MCPEKIAEKMNTDIDERLQTGGERYDFLAAGWQVLWSPQLD
jgi:hypothetical protein